MDITWKNPRKKVIFADLKPGDTFEHEGKFFIKVYDADSDAKAVCLLDGHRHHFDGCVAVTRVDIRGYAEEV